VISDDADFGDGSAKAAGATKETVMATAALRSHTPTDIGRQDTVRRRRDRRFLGMSPRPLLALLASSSVFVTIASAARADEGFAEPPPNVHVAAETHERPILEPSLARLEPEASSVRLLVGPAGKIDRHGAEPGLFVATEFGSGLPGLRLEAAWLGVGNPRGVAQYTSELTLDFGARSWVHPVLGAGAGVARTSSSAAADGTLDPNHGATLGVGVIRTGVSFRLPLDETDARIALDASGIFPAIHGADAPKGLTPWATGTVGVLVGF
jgi:hypothetical protein